MDLSAINLSLLIGALLVLALLVYGARDLARFSLYRTLAVAEVAFRESWRRKVLLITPLAALATLGLIALQDPADEPDAIRQAIKFCLFASGLSVIIVSLVLSCTNLPREIDSRVIFTIVTKPISRLELLAGKIIGFAGLAAVLLLIMGIFSWVLLAGMSWFLTNRIETALSAPLPQEGRRPYMEYLAAGHLLQSARIELGDDLQVYAEYPVDPADDSAAPRYFYPSDYYAAYRFELPPETVQILKDREGDAFLVADLRLPWKQIATRQLIAGDPTWGVVSPDFVDRVSVPPARVAIQVLDAQLQNLIASSVIPGNERILPAGPNPTWEEAANVALTSEQTTRVLEDLAIGPVYLAVYGMTIEYLIGATPDGVRIRFVAQDGTPLAEAEPVLTEGARSSVLVRTYLGSFGMGLSGPEADLPAPTGVLAFRGAPERPGSGDSVGFHLEVAVERTGQTLEDVEEAVLEVVGQNVETGFASEPVRLFPESRRPVYFEVPRAAVEGGDFDLRFRTLSRGQIISMSGDRVTMMVDREPFALNLLKALGAQWLLGLLVIVSGLTFSTFVSWPIAATLTLVGLLGRWVVGQLGAAFEPGAGRQAAETIFGTSGDVATKQVVSVGVDALNSAFATLTSFLPDLAAYGVADSVERGLAIPWADLGSAAVMTLGFAVPLAALGYIVLRNKEVAP